MWQSRGPLQSRLGHHGGRSQVFAVFHRLETRPEGVERLVEATDAFPPLQAVGEKEHDRAGQTKREVGAWARPRGRGAVHHSAPRSARPDITQLRIPRKQTVCVVAAWRESVRVREDGWIAVCARCGKERKIARSPCQEATVAERKLARLLPHEGIHPADRRRQSGHFEQEAIRVPPEERQVLGLVRENLLNRRMHQVGHANLSEEDRQPNRLAQACIRVHAFLLRERYELRPHVTLQDLRDDRRPDSRQLGGSAGALLE
mmetsp:Transcript_35456/g.97926  ORF Transcript_35456/g.97926 Transcript_35456/m.97926 type:complete len:260 (-) Transcript_35456:988-1767(-)